MLILVTSIKLVAEIALMALLGQWLVGILSGQRRDSNLFYQLFAVLTRPFVAATRWVSPRFVLDRHIPLAAFSLLAMLWLAATLAKVSLCVQAGVQVCR